MSHRTIFLGMPSYGTLTASSARAFYNACADDTARRRCPDESVRDRVIKEVSVGSLLAANMNKLWARALTLKHHGQQVDYFAMLHDDIGCEDFWIDKLIDELEANDLDMLGVVAPIKDNRGITSIALAHPDGDPMHVLCRLSMDEVYRLPPTFTSEDVGHPLLLNTGCWVCRFDRLSEMNLHFTINDEVTFNPRTKEYEAQVESEDWFFSRRAHEAGARIGCTRKVALVHEGPTRYLNTEPWGKDKWDKAVKASVIPGRKDGFKFPHDVDGWLFQHEGEALAELARGKRVLEIGSYCGRSTICLAQTADLVFSIDPHDGRGTPQPKNTFEDLKANLIRYGVANRVDIFIDTSDATEFCKIDFDLAFIDGAHDHESVQNDIINALKVLKPDGLLAFHDYRNNGGDPGVKQAVDELIADGAKLLSIHGSVAVVKPPAEIPLEV